MSSPQITYLANVGAEIQWNAPLYDLAAVAQAIQTRLLLFQGEWWAATQDGLPLWQSIVGVGAGAAALQAAEALISACILGTPFVISISGVAASYNPATRAFSYSATVTTQFGTIVLPNIPTPFFGVL